MLEFHLLLRLLPHYFPPLFSLLHPPSIPLLVLVSSHPRALAHARRPRLNAPPEPLKPPHTRGTSAASPSRAAALVVPSLRHRHRHRRHRLELCIPFLSFPRAAAELQLCMPSRPRSCPEPIAPVGWSLMTKSWSLGPSNHLLN